MKNLRTSTHLIEFGLGSCKQTHTTESESQWERLRKAIIATIQWIVLVADTMDRIFFVRVYKLTNVAYYCSVLFQYFNCMKRPNLISISITITESQSQFISFKYNESNVKGLWACISKTHRKTHSPYSAKFNIKNKYQLIQRKFSYKIQIKINVSISVCAAPLFAFHLSLYLSIYLSL